MDSIPASLPPDPIKKIPRPLFLSSWFYPLILSFVLVVLFGARLVNDSDLGFHLRTGQWIYQNHRLPAQDAFTYTASSREYLDMEWLYQGAVYLIWRLGDYALLSISHTLLALAAFGLLWFRLRETGASPWSGVLLFLTAVLACEPRFRVRPEILTWVFLSLDLWILESRLQRKRDLLYLLPVIQLFWVNTEGLFFLGPAVIAIYLIASFSSSPKADPKLIRYGVLSAAACLANPYLIRGALFPFSLLSTLSSSNIFKYTVQEFQPPWSFTPSPWTPAPSFLWAYKFFCFFLIFFLLGTSKNRKIHEWLIAVFFFLISAMAVRNIPLFLIACAPLAAAAWKDWKGPRLQKFQETLLFKPWTSVILVLFLLVFSAGIVTNAHYVSNRLTDRFGWGLDAHSQPVQACRFLTENHLDGKILNDLDDGDWIEWLTPQKTFIDGRLELMGRDFLTQYFQAQAPGGLAPLLGQYQPDILFFNPLLVPQWSTLLQNRPDWRLVYMDSLNAIYLKRGYGDQIPGLDFGKLLEANGISPTLINQAPLLLQAGPPPNPGWIDLIRPVTYPNDLLNLGIFSSYVGQPQASELFFLEAIRLSHGRYTDFYYDLGLVFANANLRDAAALCMKRVLREKPWDPVARQIAGM